MLPAVQAASWGLPAARTPQSPWVSCRCPPAAPAGSAREDDKPVLVSEPPRGLACKGRRLPAPPRAPHLRLLLLGLSDLHALHGRLQAWAGAQTEQGWSGNSGRYRVRVAHCESTPYLLPRNTVQLGLTHPSPASSRPAKRGVDPASLRCGCCGPGAISRKLRLQSLSRVHRPMCGALSVRRGAHPIHTLPWGRGSFCQACGVGGECGVSAVQGKVGDEIWRAGT